MFKLLTENIYKLDIPFENITTSSFLVTADDGDIVVDCGTTESDVKNILLPALTAMNAKVKYLFLTHSHGDHAGGAPTLLRELSDVTLLSFNGDWCKNNPNSRLLKNKDAINENISFLSLPGHSFDSGALLDKRTDSLITGDCLQLWGISRYGCGVGQPKEYQKTLAGLRAKPPENIFAAHEYYPLGSNAFGKEEVINYISECESIYSELCKFTLAKQLCGITEAEAITAAFMAEKQKSHLNMPTISPGVIECIQKALSAVEAL